MSNWSSGAKGSRPRRVQGQQEPDPNNLQKLLLSSRHQRTGPTHIVLFRLEHCCISASQLSPLRCDVDVNRLATSFDVPGCSYAEAYSLRSAVLLL